MYFKINVFLFFGDIIYNLYFIELCYFKFDLKIYKTFKNVRIVKRQYNYLYLKKQFRPNQSGDYCFEAFEKSLKRIVVTTSCSLCE